jgi:hypothetical protein
MLDSETSEVRILCLGIGVGRYLPSVQSHSMYAIESNAAKIRSRRRAACDGLTALTFPNSKLYNRFSWQHDLLPHDRPHTRIFNRGCAVDTHSQSLVSCQYLMDHARTLVSDPCLERQLPKVFYGQKPVYKNKRVNNIKADKQANNHLRGARPGRHHREECVG